MNKFDALVLKSKNKIDLEKNIKLPKLLDNKILVKIFYSGLCRSQIMEIEQKRGKDKYLPHLLGHEATGKVINIGKKVKTLKVGDRVVLSWINSKGLNSGGIKFLYKNKLINAGPVSTFSNYSIVSENKCTKVHRNFPKDTGVVFGCAALTGMGMVLNEVNLKKSDDVLLIGFGGIGFFIYAAILSKKVNNLYILENNKEKKKFLKKLKFNHIISEYNYLKKKNKKFDYCFDATGSAKAIEYGFDLLKNKGTLIFASHPPKNQKIRLDPFELIKGKKIIGSWGGKSNPNRDIVKFYNILKKLNFMKYLKTKTYKLHQIRKAIIDLKKGKVLRPIIKCS